MSVETCSATTQQTSCISVGTDVCHGDWHAIDSVAAGLPHQTQHAGHVTNRH